MKVLTILAVLLVTVASSLAPELPQISAEGSTRINRFLKGVVSQDRVPGLVAIVANRNQILYYEAFGRMDVANNISMRKDAIFRIASMTKPITSAAVMMLHEAGKFDLDDPISDYIPALKGLQVIKDFGESDASFTARPAATEITVRHLLSHTSGLGYSFSNKTLSLLQKQTGKPATELPLLHEPGARWTYGMSTKTLGELVEIVSGMNLDQFLEARIFKPLGMLDTAYVVPEEKVGRRVKIYRRKEGNVVEIPDADQDEGVVRGDGGLRSTASDYIRFLQMLLNGGRFQDTRILSAESVALMTQNQIGDLVVEKQIAASPALSQDFPLGAGHDKFGLGFQISVSDPGNGSGRSPGSYSWAGVANTHFWGDPSTGIACVLLMQVLPFYDDDCIDTLRGFEEQVYAGLERPKAETP